MIKNLLIIDSSIPSVDTFINGLNDDTCHVLYTVEDTFISLKERIEQLNVPHFQHIGIVFVDEHSPLKMFVSYNTFISYNDTGIIENNTTLFIKEIITQYSPDTLDFLACNLLSYDTWKKYFEYLMLENEGVTVRASEDRTGNLNAGGNWVLESTYDDVTHLYFKDEIGEWNYLLDFGNHSAIIGIDGKLYTCGSNSGGQLGRVVSNDNNIFVAVPDISDVVMVSTGTAHTVILKKNGEVWACGANSSGQLGDGTGVNSTVFVQSSAFNSGTSGSTSPITDAIAVVCGDNHTVIIREIVAERQVWACGSNSHGQLGGSTSTINRLFFIRSSAFESPIIDATAIACGSALTVIIREVGLERQVWACGLNSHGQLGAGMTLSTNGVTTTRFFFVQSLAFNNGLSGDRSPITDAIAVACGGRHTVIIREIVNSNEKLEQQVWACGRGSDGQLGNGTTGHFNTFIRSSAFNSGTSGETSFITNATAIACGGAHTVIIREIVNSDEELEQQVWGCGFNSFAFFTQYSAVNSGTSGETSFITDATAIACGDEHTVIIREVGLERQVWAVGSNANGQLGDGYSYTGTLLFNISVLSPFQPVKYTKSAILNPLSDNFTSLTTFDSYTYFPDMVSKTIRFNDVTNTDNSFSSFSSFNILKIIKLEPANTVFSDYISFDITDVNTVTPLVYFKSETDSEPVILGNNPNNYGAYYIINENSTGIKIFTKHFSEIAIASSELTVSLTVPSNSQIRKFTLFTDDTNNIKPGKVYINTSLDETNNIDFSINLNNPDQDPKESFKIIHNGNIGISTNRPQATLDVNGSIKGVITTGQTVYATGSSFEVNGIPEWAKRITLVFNDLGTASFTAINFSLATSNFIYDTGYISIVTTNVSGSSISVSKQVTGGFHLRLSSTSVCSGYMTLIKTTNIKTNLNNWISSTNYTSQNVNGTNINSIVESHAFASGFRNNLPLGINRIVISLPLANHSFNSGTVTLLYEG